MAHAIEPAKSGRSSCATCGAPIEKGTLRLSEAYVTDEGRGARELRNARFHRPSPLSDRPYYEPAGPDVWARFHHLPCAARAQPYKLRSALASCTLEIPDRDELDRAMERALAIVDAAEENEQTREDYQRFIELLETAPDDDHLMVFGDWLQSVGDPRGELVAVQYGLESATGDARVALADREKKLLAVHQKHLRPGKFDGSLTWRRGFVHRITLTALDPMLPRIFAHPSLRLVREVAVDVNATWLNVVVAANLPRPLPTTVRVIELRCRGETAIHGPIDTLLASGLPQLRRLAIDGPADLANLAHPTLAELELGCTDATAATGDPDELSALRRARCSPALVERVRDLGNAKLPSLTRVVLRIDRGLDATLIALVATRLLDQVRELSLHGDLTQVGLAALRDRSFARLDVRHTRFGLDDLELLRAHAADVVVDQPAPAPVPTAPVAPREWLVRHTRRPEWGLGRVIEETEAGLEIEFEAAGKKLVRNAELLEDVSA